MGITFHKWVGVNIKRRLLISSAVLLLALLFGQIFIVINSSQEQKIQFTTFANIVADAVRNNNLASVQKISLIVLRDLKGQWIAIIDSSEKTLWSYPPQKEIKNAFLFKHVQFQIDSINGPLNLVASVPLIPNLPVFITFVFGTLFFISFLSWSIAGTLKRLSVDFSRELTKLIKSDTEINICELENTRQQLNQLRIQEAIQAKKLRDEAALVSVGEIVNHVAHDLRSPLQTLLTSIGRIENKAQGDTEIAAYADAARQSADRIKLMADDLLDYKKAREIQPTPVTIEKLINDSLKDMLVPANQRGVKILTSVPPNVLINVDAYKVQRVLANIALNAIQAIPHEHGIIEISTSILPAPSVGEGKDDGEEFLLIAIKDNGCGIKSEHLSKIFDCSFTYGKRGGTGLGLAYCLNVIEAHKGTVTVESEESKGTKFTISLPESVILSKGDNVASKPILIDPIIADKPANGKPSWMLVANEPEIKKTWHALSAKHESTIGTEIEALEDLIKKKIDYSALKGVIIDCAFGQGGLGMTDVVDITAHVKSKGVQNIHLFTSEQLPEKFMKRFEARGVNIRSKPLNEDAYKMIFS